MTSFVWLTPEGYERLQQKRNTLIKQRSSAVGRMRQDLESESSDDGNYSTESVSGWALENRLHEVDKLLGHAKIIKPVKHLCGAGLGSTVYLKRGGLDYKFTLVQPMEADPSIGLVSIESPLGKAVLGKKSGGLIKVKTPLGDDIYRIIRINEEKF